MMVLQRGDQLFERYESGIVPSPMFLLAVQDDQSLIESLPLSAQSLRIWNSTYLLSTNFPESHGHCEGRI